MAPSVTPQRRTRDGESDDDGDRPASSQDSSQSSKRARRNPKDSSPSSAPLLSTGATVNGIRSTTEHQPGAIVRVKLRNFVTYTSVEIFPGPTLNMVIGPNGTGKSTLVCAICLGLGWDPKYLGRQKEPSEFVKSGESEATIEIELKKNAVRQNNPIIRCVIKREGSSTKFWVNGQQSSRKQTQNMARKFAIQIDNLCQFLPQDKVVEFAAMSPVDLLKSTQQAVASRGMNEWHVQLKELRKNQREYEHARSSQADTLANLEGRQRMQEGDVVRMREREQVQQKVRHWKLLRPFAEFREALDESNARMERLKEAQAELDELMESQQPFLDSTNAKAAYRDEVKAVVVEGKKSLEAVSRRAKDKKVAYEQIMAKIARFETQRTNETKSRNDCRHEMRTLHGTIQTLQSQLENTPTEYDAAFHSERIRAAQGKEKELIKTRGELDVKKRQIQADAEQRAIRIARAEKELTSLDTQAGKQANILRKTSQDSAKLWEYIQEHQDEFERKVFGPPIVECSVKDPGYVAQVESFFQQNNFIAFTVQTKKDFNTLQNIVYQRLHLHQITIRNTMGIGLDKFRPTISKEELTGYGLDGFALDYMNGPEPVLAMLCDDIGLHRSAVSLNDTTQEQFDAISRSNVATWTSKKSTYKIVRRREYGPGATSTSVRELRPAQYWVERPIDPQAKTGLQRDISEMREEQNELKAEAQKCMDQINGEMRSGIREAQEERKAYEAEKEKLLKASRTYAQLPTRLETCNEKMAALESRLEDIIAQSYEVDQQLEIEALSMAQASIEYATAVERIQQAYPRLQEAELMHIEASSDYESLVEKNKEVQAQLNERKAEVKEVEQTLQVTIDKRTTVLRICKKIKKNAAREGDQDLLDFIASATNLTIENVEAEIVSEEARLDLMHEGNGRVIEEYEEREKKIAALKLKLQGAEGQLEQVSAQITEIRSQWEPKLDRLIKRISDSFAFNMKQINCAGEVSIDKDEDFDQWAIKIQVKFREEEALTQLDSHRQSGGERAVSTIFYLMSLQALTRAPFRVVDEINQGMDPRNERLVHSRMVAIATGNDSYEESLASRRAAAEDAGDENDEEREDGVAEYGGGSQYFLITPKLLHGLRYEKGMRVLCIASGEYMPEDQGQASFKRSLEIRNNMNRVAIAG